MPIATVFSFSMSKNGLECTICLQKCQKPSTTRVHVMSHFFNDQDYFCYLCRKKFHFKVLNFLSDLIIIDFSFSKFFNNVWFTFLQLKLLRHIKQFHKLWITENEIKNEKLWQKIRKDSRRDGRTVCSICSKQFSHFESLRDHVMDVHLFWCGKCKESFYSTLQLRMHNKKIHEPHNIVRQFQCDLCPKQYNTREKIVNHITVQ